MVLLQRVWNRSLLSEPAAQLRDEGRGIIGGGIYDAMLAHCALKAKAETIYTWNIRHYSQCGPEVSGRLRTPAKASLGVLSVLGGEMLSPKLEVS